MSSCGPLNYLLKGQPDCKADYTTSYSFWMLGFYSLLFEGVENGHYIYLPLILPFISEN